MRIGIICPNWVGDAVMSFPFINACRAEYPDAVIILIGKTWVADVFVNHPAINGMITLTKKELTGLHATTEAGRCIRALELDRLYLLSDSFRSAYMGYVSGSPVRIGYGVQFRSFYLTKVIRKKFNHLHRTEKYLNLLNHSGSLKEEGMGIVLSKDEKKWADEEMAALELEDPIALFPFSVASSRTIPENKLAEILSHDGNQFLVFGSANDKDKGKALLKKVNSSKLKSVCGKYTLRKSIALISRCKAVIAADSGLGHIAANLNIFTVSMFGAGNPLMTGPKGESVSIINEKVYCSPCNSNYCKNKKEPLLCLESINSEKPFQELDKLMTLY